MDLMPSGAAAGHGGAERGDAAAPGAGLAAQRDDAGRAGAVGEAGAAAAFAAGGSARSRAHPAMQAAAAVGHGRLAAGALRAGVGAAAGCCEEIAGAVAVPEAAAAVGRE